MKNRMTGLRSYQDIKTPEELEEEREREYLKGIERAERAEYLAEAEREERLIRGED